MLTADLDRLLGASGWPAVSVLCSADRTTWPALLDEARARLADMIPDRCVQRLLDDLQEGADQVDTGDWPAFGVYVNPGFVHAVVLPQPVRSRVVIDTTFATRDLITGLARTPRYLVLTVDGTGASLWSGLGRRLVPAPDAAAFPLEFPAPPAAGERRLHQERSRIRDAHLDRCNRLVDEALDQVLRRADHRPIFVVGHQRRAHRYVATSPHAGRFAATITADPASPLPVLAEMVAPHLDRELADRGRAAIDAVGAAIGANRFAAGLPEVWTLAHDGRVDLLVVEDTYHQPATIDAVTATLALCAEPRAGHVDDAVDEVIEAVLSTGGEVHNVPTGALHEWDRIAACLRH